MADKPQHSGSEHEDDLLALSLAVGKIEQYRILESLYRKVCEEKRDLEEKLSAQQESRNKDSSGAPSGRETRVRRSFSITQQILDAATAQPLDHPTELYQVMEKEKNHEIEVLRKKSEDLQRDLKKIQHQRDELHGQIQQLMISMTEKDGRVMELEQHFQATLTEAERHRHLERERILRESAHKGAGSSWVVVNPSKTLLVETIIENQDDLMLGTTAALRQKIDELQRRITELLNHNEKWNALCQELQQELDRVRGQLSQYQKEEMQGMSSKPGLFHDLKSEQKRRMDAEEMSLKAKKQVDELEAKVVDLETQLVEKEKQERKMLIEAEELREKALVYEEQILSYKEDFENEQRDHTITRGQLDSLKNQWLTIYKDLQEKNQQLIAMSQRIELLEHNNNELLKQLDQAQRDAQLIRHHQQQQQQQQHQLTRTPQNDDLRTSWECQRCTYRNKEAAIVCEMCATARHHHASLGLHVNAPPSTSRGHTSNTSTVDRRGTFDTKSFGGPPRIGELEEDGISCY